ncbi:SDR family NAD(P)-dependent oxidoreductase [Streptomyces lavendulocolor]|uniref:SDR family NAD(P)-dependent oxidoreductase n=1 Tax=Streptomyces lavendulocolor TaxID=67316 RepID=UPI0033D59D02
MSSYEISLRGRSALITGASDGIGRAIALGLASAGANVALLARDTHALQSVASEAEQYGVKTAVITCDVSVLATISEAFNASVSALGQVDILVNNAGRVGSTGPFLELTDSDWATVARINFEAPVQFLRAFGRHAIPRGSGCVINVSSFAGSNGAPMIAHYGAAKAALNALSCSLAAEWASSGVRVNVLAPGWINTKLTAQFAEMPGVSAALLEAVPTGQWGTPDSVIGAALYLASDAAGLVTGACLEVDGGLTSYVGGPGMLSIAKHGHRIEVP